MNGPILTSSQLALWRRLFWEIPLFCGNDQIVGINEVEGWRDWADRPTTMDQSRIEDYLEETRVGGECVLHVGIGNSGLARRFSSLFSSIVGLSITEREIEAAIAMEIPNYFPHLLNKFSASFSEEFAAEFDVIVDNNPSSYACCFFHFSRMMTTYRRLLGSRGALITDAQGLGWTPSTPHANERWALDLTDWTLVGQAYGLVTEAINEHIYVSRPRHC